MNFIFKKKKVQGFWKANWETFTILVDFWSFEKQWTFNRSSHRHNWCKYYAYTRKCLTDDNITLSWAEAQLMSNLHLRRQVESSFAATEAKFMPILHVQKQKPNWFQFNTNGGRSQSGSSTTLTPAESTVMPHSRLAAAEDASSKLTNWWKS